MHMYLLHALFWYVCSPCVQSGLSTSKEQPNTHNTDAYKLFLSIGGPKDYHKNHDTHNTSTADLTHHPLNLCLLPRTTNRLGPTPIYCPTRCAAIRPCALHDGVLLRVLDRVYQTVSQTVIHTDRQTKPGVVIFLSCS